MHQHQRILAAFALCFLGGCASSQSTTTGPYQANDPASRDTHRAHLLTQRAAAMIDSDPARAEALLREALDADIFHGPAHNNLGVLHERRAEYYEAATEFEWARKLMPDHPDPRLNLALVFEHAGRITDAVEAFSAALEVAPDHVPTMSALARCQLRHGRADDSTAYYLDEIALRGATVKWREWAKLQRAKLAVR